MLFVNDPKIEDVPAVGSGVVLVAERTHAGEAVRWNPQGDAEALATFLGGGFKSFEGVVYAVAAGGVLTPVSWLGSDVVVVKPPAGELFVLSPGQLVQEYARVEVPPVTFTLTADVEEVPVDENGDGDVDELEAHTVAELQDLLREKGLAVSGSKAELVERLRDA